MSETTAKSETTESVAQNPYALVTQEYLEEVSKLGDAIYEKLKPQLEQEVVSSRQYPYATTGHLFYGQNFTHGGWQFVQPIGLHAVYMIEVMWDGQPRLTEVIKLDNPPLLGVLLMNGKSLQAEMTDDGEVSLDDL